MVFAAAMLYCLGSIGCSVLLGHDDGGRGLESTTAGIYPDDRLAPSKKEREHLSCPPSTYYTHTAYKGTFLVLQQLDWVNLASCVQEH